MFPSSPTFPNLNLGLFSPLLFGSGAVAQPTASYGATSGGIGTQVAAGGLFPALPAPAVSGGGGMSLPGLMNTPQSKIPLGGFGGTNRTQGQRTTAQTAPQLQTVPLPTSPLSAPQGTPTLQTGVEGGAMGNLAPNTNTVFDAQGNVVPNYGQYVRTASGGLALKEVSDQQRWADKVSAEQMIANGYTFNQATRTWILGTSPSSSGNTWWSQKYGTNFRVGSGYVGQFRTEQAYNTWIRQKKNLAKKEDSGGVNKATQTVNVNYGTG